jgi:hypothetical protein
MTRTHTFVRTTVIRNDLRTGSTELDAFQLTVIDFVRSGELVLPAEELVRIVRVVQFKKE